jgi:hypothetical protein
MKPFCEHKKFGLVFLTGLLIFFLTGWTGNGHGGNTAHADNFPVVVFSKVHINPFYDTSLFPALVTDDAKQALYRGNYFPGHNTPDYITNTNWPVFWCGIGHMDEKGFIDCVISC